MRITRSMSAAGLIDGAGDTHMTDDVALPSTKRTVPRKNKVQLNEDIIALIAEHCDYTTVQRLRFVSKAASLGAAKVMFKTLRKQINTRGCEQLVAIAASKYAKFAKTLSIWAPDDDQGLSAEGPPPNFVTEYFQNTKEPEIVVLGAMMSRFSRLHTLTVHLSSHLHDTMEATGPLTGKAMVAIMHGVSSANLQTPKKLRLEMMPDYDPEGSSRDWSAVNEFNGGHLGQFKDVEIVNNHASFCIHDGIQITGLLNAFHSLERLEIPETNQVWVLLQSSNKPYKFWLPRLKSLKLCCLSTTGNGLIALLSACQSTLTNLNISTAEMTSIRSEISDSLPDAEAWEAVVHSGIPNRLPYAETWEAVFDFLRTKCPELIEFKHQRLAWQELDEGGDFGDTMTTMGPIEWQAVWRKENKYEIKSGRKEDELALGELLSWIKDNAKAKVGRAPRLNFFDAGLVRRLKTRATVPARERPPQRAAASTIWPRAHGV